MFRKFLACFLFTGFAFSLLAQDSDVEVTKKSNIYVGVQVNQLIRQIVNFSSSNTPVTNPYLMTFAVNSTRTGVGFNAGLGYNFNEFNDDDAIRKRETKINDLFFRAGFEKKSSLSPKWGVSWGFDLVLDRQSNNTTTEENQGSKLNIETDTKTNATGFGPRLALNYRLSEKMLIGTECNYYFKSGKNENDVKTTFINFVFDPVTGQSRQIRQTTSTDDSQKFKRFQFNLPAVIFLILKF